MKRLLLALPMTLVACSSEPKDVGCCGPEDSGTPATTDSGEPASDPFPNTSCDDYANPCVEVSAGDNETLFETVNLLEDGMTIVLDAGTWELDNQVTLRGASGVSVIGQGMDETILDFALEEVQTNGIDAIGDDFMLQDLTVKDAKKDGVRVEDSDGVIMRRIRVTWTALESSENGAYGLYPVKSSNVLVEDCEAFNASDAGIYVGQTQHTIVRRNLATGNVAGIEIENTQYADVYDNVATGNTGGLLIFDLPGNPIIGRDIWIHDNVVTDNNVPNFAPGGTVSAIPAGTGTIVLATRRIVIEDNEYANNNSSDIAIFSGLVIEGNPADWYLTNDELVGDVSGLDLPADDAGVFNYRTENVVVSNNLHSGSGSAPDMSNLIDREIGFLLGLVYGDERVDDVLYDAIEESAFSATDASGNSNDNHVCVGLNGAGSFASLDLETLAASLESNPGPEALFRPPAPFTPFDCSELDGGPIPAISLD